jgi:hypothetical protein
VEIVNRIVALADPTIRNLQITQSYCELSQALCQFIGSGANWCTFATWASKQAGVTIRQEDLARTFERFLDRSPELSEAIDRIATSLAELESGRDANTLRPSIRHLLDPQVIFERTSDAVARGNRKVFEEIGREFARFVVTFRDDVVFDAEKLARFCEALKPGEPPDGQDYLGRALTHLYQARYESQPKAKAELMLLANLQIGLHEQTRLRPEIAAALDAPLLDPDRLKSRILDALLPRPSLFLRLRLFASRLLGWKSPLAHAAELLSGHLRALTHSVITECLMTLALPPDLVLRLGRDLSGEFPEMLQQLSHAELLGLLARIDSTPGSMAQSGTDNWSDLNDRMHFIADLFRAYQEWPQLFDPAFTPAQVLEIKAGRKPEGRL